MQNHIGNDALGVFLVTRKKSVKCGYCNKNVPTAITYQRLEPEEPYNEINLDYTINKKANGLFGVECGCYGKLHRQLAHIQTRMEIKEKMGV